MKITWNDFMVLMDALRGSCQINDGGTVFCFSVNERLATMYRLVNMDGTVGIETKRGNQ